MDFLRNTDLILVLIFMLLSICYNSDSDSWIKNCQRYHDSSTFCADLLKMTTKIIDKGLLRDALEDEPVFRKTMDSFSSKDSETNTYSIDSEKSESSPNTKDSQEIGHQAEESSSMDDYEYPNPAFKAERVSDSHHNQREDHSADDYSGLDDEKETNQESSTNKELSSIDNPISEESSKEPDAVKKTFGYKVTLYKSPNSKDPPVITEEFYGDGKKKLVNILSKTKSQQTNKNRHDSEGQPSSDSGFYSPELSGLEFDPREEEKLTIPVKSYLQKFKDKAVDGLSSINNAGDAKQHDKKGSKEKALREKTQIEFFERGNFVVVPTLEKIFSDDKKGRNAKRIYLDSFATKASPDDEVDFKNLQDLLLRRLKGWREKGYKITTELEIVHKGAQHDKSKEVKQRDNNEHELHQRVREGLDSKKEAFIGSGEAKYPPLEILQQPPKSIDYPDFVSFDNGKSNLREHHIFYRTTLPPQILRSTKIVHVITLAKNLTANQGRNKNLASITGIIRQSPHQISFKNDGLGKTSGAITLPLLTSPYNEDGQIRKKIIIRPVNKSPDSGVQQPILFQNTPIISNTLGDDNGQITLIQGPPTIDMNGMISNDQKIYDQVSLGNPTVITLASSGHSKSNGNQMRNNHYPLIIQAGQDENPRIQTNSQNSKMKLSPVAFEEPPKKVINFLKLHQPGFSNQGKPKGPSKPGNFDNLKLKFNPINVHYRPHHVMSTDNEFNDFDLEIGQHPHNFGGAFHQPLELGPSAGENWDNPFSQNSFNVDPVSYFSGDNGPPFAMPPGPPGPPGPRGPPHAMSGHFGDTPQWVGDLRGENYFLGGFGAGDHSSLSPSHVAVAGKTTSKPFFKLPKPQKGALRIFEVMRKNSHGKKQHKPEQASFLKGSTDSSGSLNNANLINQVKAQLSSDPSFHNNIYTIGFDSKRVKATKARDLLTQSSEIYPLIGGIGPFIVPSISLDEDKKIHEQEQVGGEDKEKKPLSYEQSIEQKTKE